MPAWTRRLISSEGLYTQVSRWLGNRRRKRRTRAEEKLHKFASAKTPLGKANYAIDLLDELRPDPLRDEASHFVAEVLLGKGPYVKRVIHWSRKFWKYRMGA